MFIALFLSENFLPLGVRQVIRFVVELLAAIPSVVYGLWGIAVVIPLVQQFGGYFSDYLGFIPLFSGPATGNSMLTASLVLAIMVLPTITAISRTALVAVPAHLAGRILRDRSDPLGNNLSSTHSDSCARNCGGDDSGLWPRDG